jgi:acetyl esterase/lipase
MLIGRASQDDRLCASTATRLGIVVVSAEYRLAPEHPHPAQLDDCRSGWLWFQDNAASLGVDAAQVAIGGQSAGGCLAAALVQQICDLAEPAPIAQWLFCPMLDDRTAARRELDAVGHRIWNNATNRYAWRAFLGIEPGSQTTPPYSVPARRAVHPGSPPTWIGVGDIDLFHDEDMAYASALRAAGIPVTTDVVPGVPHGFESWDPTAEVSRGYIDRAQTWLGRALGG